VSERTICHECRYMGKRVKRNIFMCHGWQRLRELDHTMTMCSEFRPKDNAFNRVVDNTIVWTCRFAVILLGLIALSVVIGLYMGWLK
jgi:hypothetical protein